MKTIRIKLLTVCAMICLALSCQNFDKFGQHDVGLVNVTGVGLNKNATAILVSGTETLYAAVSPSMATNQAVTWTSSNTAIATVSSGGMVTGVAVGSATITVTTADGGYQATCIVAVSVAKSSAKAITAFTILGVSGTIDESAKTIALTLPYGTSVSTLAPTITITGASITPASGVLQDFSSPVAYTVTAADGSTQSYIMTVTVIAPVTTSTSGSGVGATTTYTLPSGTSGVVFKTIQTTSDTLPSSITFPMGADDLSTGTISTPFVMAETLTTWELWSMVKTWATNHGYTFGNAGTNGYGNTSGSTQQPVTTISWRDDVVWCNALTEYYNSNGGSPTLDCVYYIDSSYTTPLRVSTTSNTITYTTAGTQDDPYIKASSTYNTDMANCTAKGFRLPASSEYEYAARYRGSDPANTVPGHANPYYTKGNSASGATADYTNATATSLVAVYGVSTTAVVKSKRANALGIYDMSGNVYEWCFDWYGSFYRVLRGCSFSYDISGTPVGGVFVASPYTASGSGRFSSFRFSRTK